MRESIALLLTVFWITTTVSVSAGAAVIRGTADAAASGFFVQLSDGPAETGSGPILDDDAPAPFSTAESVDSLIGSASGRGAPGNAGTYFFSYSADALSASIESDVDGGPGVRTTSAHASTGPISISLRFEPDDPALPDELLFLFEADDVSGMSSITGEVSQQVRTEVRFTNATLETAEGRFSIPEAPSPDTRFPLLTGEVRINETQVVCDPGGSVCGLVSSALIFNTLTATTPAGDAVLFAVGIATTEVSHAFTPVPEPRVAALMLVACLARRHRRQPR